MNIFYIPSWYPSANNPIYGTFVQEQIALLARLNPDWQLGVSTWGQGDPNHMLWVRHHVKNVGKVCNHGAFKPHSEASDNLYHYHTPTLTWTRKVLKGNLEGLIRANAANLEQFRQQVGKVTMLHAQATYPGALIAQALSRKYSIPYVVSIRMSPFPFPEFLDKKGHLKPLIAESLEHANRLIATSHSLEKTLLRFGLDKVDVVHNPVDMDVFHPTGQKPDGLTLLSIGRMEAQKGFDLLIRAVAKLGTDFKGTVRLGGDGQFKADYQKLAEELSVKDKFVWLGELSRKQVQVEMQRCSFYVLPSRHETFGNVLLEAMACGKPVLATRCGGPADIVTDEVGMLIGNENVEALGKGIQEMVACFSSFDPSRIRANVVSRFSPDHFSKQMREIYSNNQ